LTLPDPFRNPKLLVIGSRDELRIEAPAGLTLKFFKA